MYIRIERGSSAPISKQIAEQIRSQCLSGVLKPEQCLPSVRQLARELAVNVNTVVRVYERLTSEGLLETRHGEGTFVLPPSKRAHGDKQLEQQRSQLQCELDAVVRRGILLGLTSGQMRSMLTKAASDAKTQIQQQKSMKVHDE